VKHGPDDTARTAHLPVAITVGTLSIFIFANVGPLDESCSSTRYYSPKASTG
jgi:hypothetical protein